MMKRKVKVLPTTKLGIWSAALIVAMPLLFLIGSSFTHTLYEAVPSGETILADIAARPALALTMLAGMAAGISAFVTGLLAILVPKERSILVYLSTLVGLLFVFYLAAELTNPH